MRSMKLYRQHEYGKSEGEQKDANSLSKNWVILHFFEVSHTYLPFIATKKEIRKMGKPYNQNQGSDFRCILCKSHRIIKLRSIESEVLIQRYQSQYNINVRGFFFNKQLILAHCTQCNLQFFIGARCGDSGFYSQLYNKKGFYEQNKPEFEFALNKLGQYPIQSVLDVGCGTGAFLKKIRTSFYVRGLETNPIAIKILKDSGIMLDSGQEVYDLIVAFQVLEHVPSPLQFIKSLLAKLKREGFLFITVPNRDSVYCKEVDDLHNYPPHHMTWWDRKSLDYLANTVGMRVIEYYHEPLRIIHYKSIIESRRRQILNSSRKVGLLHTIVARATYRIGRILDNILMPYVIDFISYPGHTLGIILKRE